MSCKGAEADHEDGVRQMEEAGAGGGVCPYGVKVSEGQHDALIGQVYETRKVFGLVERFRQLQQVERLFQGHLIQLRP